MKFASPKELQQSVDSHMAEMISQGKLGDYKAKGAAGEAAVMDIMHDYRNRRGGLLYQGFMYPYASDRSGKLYLGNIFWNEETQEFTDVTRQVNDEIDVLFISHYRIFAIEVKSYHIKKAVLTNQWMTREGKKVDKAPTAQAEKHARHLYHQLYEVLPDGDPRYIIPLVCFVDRVEKEFDDQRDSDHQLYMPVCPINQLQSTILDRDFSDTGYTLDLDAIEKKLKSIQRERTIDD